MTPQHTAPVREALRWIGIAWDKFDALLTTKDFKLIDGELTIDGIPVADWFEAVFEYKENA